MLGTAVGGFILLVNAKTFLEAVGLDPSLNIIVYVAILDHGALLRNIRPSSRAPAGAGDLKGRKSKGSAAGKDA